MNSRHVNNSKMLNAYTNCVSRKKKITNNIKNVLHEYWLVQYPKSYYIKLKMNYCIMVDIFLVRYINNNIFIIFILVLVVGKLISIKMSVGTVLNVFHPSSI